MVSNCLKLSGRTDTVTKGGLMANSTVISCFEISLRINTRNIMRLSDVYLDFSGSLINTNSDKFLVESL